jgi:hypothetical protein
MYRRLRQLSLVAIAFFLIVPGISQARNDDTEAAKANARQQIQNLKENITGLNVLIKTTDAAIATTKVAIKKEENKPCPDLGTLLGLNLTLGGLEITREELLKEKAAKEKLLGEWEAFLRTLGG